jgi:hypothetical protein
LPRTTSWKGRRGQQAGQHPGAQVEALLPDQPGDDAHHRHLAPPGQAAGPEQGRLVALLAREVAFVEVVRQVPVGGRVPLGLVEAVQDPPQHVAPGPQVAVEAHPVLRGLDLPGVGGAHGGDGPGVQDAGLEVAEAAGGERVLVQQVAGGEEPGVGQDPGVEGALVPQVVDGEQRPGAVEELVPGEDAAQQERHQGGLPVVDVGHVRREPHGLAGPQGGPLQRREAQVLVGPVAVDRGAVEEARAAHEVDRQVGAGERRGVDGDPDAVGAEGELQLRDHGAEVPAGRLDPGVHRQEGPDVVAEPVEQPGQGGGDVAEPPRLGEGGQLGREEQDPHRPSP